MFDLSQAPLGGLNGRRGRLVPHGAARAPSQEPGRVKTRWRPF